MKDFKKIMLGMQAQSKTYLSRLYVDKFTKNPELLEDEKIYIYRSLSFWFQGTGWRNAEKIIMMVLLPVKASVADVIPVGTYLLNRLAPMIQAWSEENKNDDKAREKAQFFVQNTGNRMLRRSGMTYNEAKGGFVLRMLFQVPLINAVSVNGKAAYRSVADLLNLIEECITTTDAQAKEAYVRTYRRQQRIRQFMKENGYCAFVANGSILPREKDGNEPMRGATPFVAPKELEVLIDLSETGVSDGESEQGASVDGAWKDRQIIRGMGIPRGITVITGGGYSGKSTLLDALEAGIYDHVPGDGREYVLSEESALKVYAEDGRPVSGLDMSAFFRFLPGKSLLDFSTDHASGSVSQASNILEAVGGGSQLLLIDEDKSATNFMIRDQMMRLLVEDEPIIPFTERVQELWQEKQVSTILVIGGSSEYLRLADQVILMKDYKPHVITERVKELLKLSAESRQWQVKAGSMSSEAALAETWESYEPATWQFSRRLLVKETSQPFLFFRTVETENEKKVILDEYSADVTMLTAMTSHEQLCTLTVIMEHLLTDLSGAEHEILENVKAFLEELLTRGKTGSIMPETQCWFYEEIRPLDALCCINRMRGVTFK
ncbi:MAG: hypothetical protein IKO03_03850 [Lachnospiraceae bacterium]|nr:hypothetical protein [Lachnospiraceae bacterium]MBR3507910.1 hypothetical protein [Lachnospiraceae bacterium]MBR4606101.1 hypothetical protein [Lachnospiraceae bacterium]